MRHIITVSLAVTLVACSGEAETAKTEGEGAQPAASSLAEASEQPSLVRASMAQASAAGAGRCTNIMGQMVDPDPAGRNVRDAPGTNGRILGVIPPPSAGSEDTRPARFSIIDSRNGWLLIENGRFDDALTGPGTPAVYSGRGWISGRGVMVGIQTSVGFGEPSHDAPITFDMREAGGVVMSSELEGFRIRGVAGCRGNWVQLDWEMPDYRGVSAIGFARSAVASENPLIVRAWFAGVCNSQETTCDGTNGDTPDTAFADQTANPIP